MIYILKKNGIFSLDVKENRVTCEITNSYHINSWNYKYEIRDRNLYITVYNLSSLNPMGKRGWLAVDIAAGYNDFDNIYIDNGPEKEPSLIWKRENLFSLDKLSDLGVTNNEFSCTLDYEYWGYDYDLQNKILYIDLFETEEINEGGLKIKIDKGYENFNEVRIMGFGFGKGITIWSKTE